MKEQEVKQILIEMEDEENPCPPDLDECPDDCWEKPYDVDCTLCWAKYICQLFEPKGGE